jgi:hypothetical protein
MLLIHWVSVLVWRASASDTIKANGYTSCSEKAVITVSGFSFSLSRSDKTVAFSISGSSTSTSYVIADFRVTAYGITATQMTLDPCEHSIRQLCPLQAGPFHESATFAVPDQVSAQIPAAAWMVPDLEGLTQVKLHTKEGQELACLQAVIANEESTKNKGARVATIGMALGALAVSSIATLAAGTGAVTAGAAGTAGGLNVLQLVQYFSDISWSGAFSVNTPPVYVSFTQNFAWSNGFVVMAGMQRRIDHFRGRTGGNLNKSSYDILMQQHLIRKSVLQKREGPSKVVSGIQGYVEELRVPSENTFMTVFLIFLGLLGAIVVGCVLMKGVLELWATKRKLPNGLESFRIHFWTETSGLIVRTILVIYSTWTIICLYQFKNGDSWAATVLAGTSLALFSATLLFFTIQVTRIAVHAKRVEGGTAKLYEDKPSLRKYGLLYDQYRKEFWWFFVPCILYSVMKALFIAFGDGHGLIQVVGQLACELAMIVFLFSTRAYDGKTANVVNILISVVRIMTLVGTLIFVDVFGVAGTTKSVAAIAMIALQSVLTAVLFGLLVYNALLPWIRQRKLKRKRLSMASEEGLPLRENHGSKFSPEENPLVVDTTMTHKGREYQQVSASAEEADTRYKRYLSGPEDDMVGHAITTQSNHSSDHLVQSSKAHDSVNARLS